MCSDSNLRDITGIAQHYVPVRAGGWVDLVCSVFVQESCIGT